ncbi:MAG: stage II sporulation protein R [Candidatus Merdivicinus sp.]|jgi:stage II sporulation protein R
MDAAKRLPHREDRAVRTVILTVALAFLLAVFLDSFSAFHQECAQIQQEVLRLHILANSDREEDQALKLAVRDRILADTGGLFNRAESQADAREAAFENLGAVEAAARAALLAEGSDAPVRAEVVRMFFDTRVYDGFTMPAGWYDALRVVIGEGAGHNWWCVLYPPLCVSAAEKLPEELERFSEEERALLESEPRYEVRFFLVELLEKMGIWFRSWRAG